MGQNKNLTSLPTAQGAQPRVLGFHIFTGFFFGMDSATLFFGSWSFFLFLLYPRGRQQMADDIPRETLRWLIEQSQGGSLNDIRKSSSEAVKPRVIKLVAVRRAKGKKK